MCGRSHCPHIYCGRCADKMRSEYGSNVFIGGCPVCKELCCCSSKNVMCHRLNHCYRKCPATKTHQRTTSGDESSEGDVVSPCSETSVVLDCLTTSNLGKRSDGAVELDRPGKSLRSCSSLDNSYLPHCDWLLPLAGGMPFYQASQSFIFPTSAANLASSLCYFYPSQSIRLPVNDDQECKVGGGVERLAVLALVSSFALEQAGVHS